MTIQEAFEDFMRKDFEKTVEKSTKAYLSYYAVELFPEGTYRVLWGNQIGNQYESTGLIIRVPALNDNDWDDNPVLRYYGNAEDEIWESFREKTSFCG